MPAGPSGPGSPTLYSPFAPFAPIDPGGPGSPFSASKEERNKNILMQGIFKLKQIKRSARTLNESIHRRPNQATVDKKIDIVRTTNWNALPEEITLGFLKADIRLNYHCSS